MAKKVKVIRKKEWKEFATNNITPKLREIGVSESFLIDLDRKGIHNGLSDLGRDGSHKGKDKVTKLHAAFKQELHPEYEVEKVCNDPNNKRLITHLKITRLL